MSKHLSPLGFSMPKFFRFLRPLCALSLLLAASCSGSSGDIASSSVAPSPATDEDSSGRGLVVQVQPDEDPERPGYFDFKVVENGQYALHTFVLKNSDPRDVTIQKVDPGCGCTVARIMKVEADGTRTPPLAKKPLELLILKPGEIAEIALRVDTGEVKVKNTDKHFMVRVSTNSVERPYLTLECHLVVDMPWQLAPASVNLPQVPEGAGATGRITIKALGTAGLTLGEIRELPEGATATLTRQGQFMEPVWVLDAGFTPPVPLGRQAFSVWINTIRKDGTEGEPLQVLVAGTTTPDVSFSPGRMILRPNPKGVGVKTDDGLGLAIAKLKTHLQGHSLRVVGFQILGDHADELEFNVTPVRPNQNGGSIEWDLSLIALDTLSAPSFTGTIVLEIDDPQYKEMKLDYVGLGFDQ
jgi:hypothetical protein